MKLTVQHKNIRSTAELDSQIEEKILSLQPALQIDEACVSLARDYDASPPFQVKVHLVTPGPDVLAEGCDHTLEAAFNKVMSSLRDKIGNRATRRQKRLRDQAPILRAS